MRGVSTVLIMFISLGVFAQEPKKDAKTQETKMDVFSSKTGSIVKFLDFQLPVLKVVYGAGSENRVRKITSGSSTAYFYQIVKEGKYGSSTASIEYSDLLEIIKAMASLKADIEKDVALVPDYLENKFTTVDGFQVGYYIQKGKAVWYLRLEKYGSDNTIFIENAEVLENSFGLAKTKIEDLKK